LVWRHNFPRPAQMTGLRCGYIVEQAVAICRGQFGPGTVENAAATRAMFVKFAEPI